MTITCLACGTSYPRRKPTGRISHYCATCQKGRRLGQARAGMRRHRALIREVEANADTWGDIDVTRADVKAATEWLMGAAGDGPWFADGRSGPRRWQGHRADKYEGVAPIRVQQTMAGLLRRQLDTPPGEPVATVSDRKPAGWDKDGGPYDERRATTAERPDVQAAIEQRAQAAAGDDKFERADTDAMSNAEYWHYKGLAVMAAEARAWGASQSGTFYGCNDPALTETLYGEGSRATPAKTSTTAGLFPPRATLSLRPS